MAKRMPEAAFAVARSLSCPATLPAHFKVETCRAASSPPMDGLGDRADG